MTKYENKISLVLIIYGQAYEAHGQYLVEQRNKANQITKFLSPSMG